MAALVFESENSVLGVSEVELGRVSELENLALTSSSCCVQCARYAHDEKGFDEKEQKSRYEF